MNGTQDIKVIRPGSSAELLSVVPGLVGFAPEQSLVLVGVEGPRDRVKVTLRYDLPGSDDLAAAHQIVEHAILVLARADVGRMVAVIYGPDDMGMLFAALLAEQDMVTPLDVLRVDGGRYWSYACADESCCPAAGTPFEVNVPDEFSTPLDSRAVLAEQVAPVPAEQAQVVRRATERASQLAGDMPRRAVQVALNVTQLAIASYRAGGEIGSPDEVATVLVGLRDLRVRDDAWSRMDLEYVEAHTKLWIDLTRIAPPGFVAAPASLLAFCAWQDGNGALANVALDRAQADDPKYCLADLLRQMISAGAPPSLARLPMTPEEVAASYDEQD